ncbi:ABC transporter substrate-binding protein [Acuticoccus mangrovi]|uniref:ABC transporter substrate-binding protein n=1 Tax=Acuticoccus mangrovi TaxID=2796142 RepID=A0A934IVJ2_9HYPH|nr:ABC transporter substrate-binding protein [Acuticoccus mangrovi]MBJ3778800.1 ABC transporter substrate-binding protein [Acuticoccus mangrovi]
MRIGLLSLIGASLLAMPLTATAKDFTWAFQGDVQEMDPQARRETFTTSVINNIMEGLVRYDQNLRIEPALATSWELPEPKRWRFHLREGVTFHNGNPFTADDVIVTYERGSSPDSFFRGGLANITGMEKVDDYTVDVTTDVPYPLLLNDLTNMLIFDREWLEEHDALNPVNPAKGEDGYTMRHAMGTGPFKLVEYRRDDRTVFEVNEDWWDNANKVHNLTHVVFRPISSDATRVAALLSGELDLMFPAPLQDIDRINATPGYKVIESPELRTLMMGFEMGDDELHNSNIKGKNPLKGLKVREAIMQAIDIDLIVDKVMRGHAIPASVIMPKALNGYDDRLDGRLLPYDPAAAKAKLAEAGYPDGFSMGMDCPNDRYVNDEEVCVAIVAMLARVGIEAKLTAQTRANHFPKVQAGESDFWMLGWAASTTVDAHNFLNSIMVTPDGVKGAYNPGNYSNARVDELEPLIAQETDPKKRADMIYEAFKIHKEEIGHLPLHTQTNVWAVRDGIEVVQPANGVLPLMYVHIDD